MDETHETKNQDKGMEQGREKGMGQGPGEAVSQSKAEGQGKAHFLDLKLPIGWLLSAYGLVLGIYGLVTKKEMYDKSLGLNVNLTWGIIMLVVGGAFLLTAFLKKKRVGPQDRTENK